MIILEVIPNTSIFWGFLLLHTSAGDIVHVEAHRGVHLLDIPHTNHPLSTKHQIEMWNKQNMEELQNKGGGMTAPNRRQFVDWGQLWDNG